MSCTATFCGACHDLVHHDRIVPLRQQASSSTPPIGSPDMGRRPIDEHPPGGAASRSSSPWFRRGVRRLTGAITPGEQGSLCRVRRCTSAARTAATGGATCKYSLTSSAPATAGHSARADSSPHNPLSGAMPTPDKRTAREDTRNGSMTEVTTTDRARTRNGPHRGGGRFRAVTVATSRSGSSSAGAGSPRRARPG